MLRRKQKKKFYQKLTPIISKKLTWMQKFDDWSFADISRESGVAQNRISEIIHYKNYPECALNEKNLCLLIGAGMLTLDELISKDELNPQEKKELEAIVVCNDQKLRMLVIQAITEGKDPVEILKKELEK